MMKFPRTKIVMLAIGVGVTLSGCSDDDDGTTPPPPEPSLMATLAEEDRFSIFTDALERTGLDARLEEESDLTVFAPNNAAFDDLFTELGVSDLDAVEAAVGSDRLRNMVLYHLMDSEVKASGINSGYRESEGLNVNDNKLSLYFTTGNQMMINNKAGVVDADIDALNGVAHEINAVLMPLNVFELIEVNPDFSSLESALILADGDLDLFLADVSNTYTLFAPDNAAFDSLIENSGANSLAEWVTSQGTDVVANILQYHVLTNEMRADEFSTGGVNTAAPDPSGGNYEFFMDVGTDNVNIIDNNATTTNVTITKTDLTAINGTVHFVDGVLLPE